MTNNESTHKKLLKIPSTCERLPKKLIDEAISCLSRKLPNEALKYLQQATLESATQRDLNLVWGMYHAALGELNQAIKYLGDEIRLHPNNSVASKFHEELREEQRIEQNKKNTFTNFSNIPSSSVSQHSTNQTRKMRILMPYSVKREYGRITLPEWIRQSFNTYFSDQCEVFACGPGNDIEIPDTSEFYNRVEQLVKELKIDLVFDIEGGAETLDFMFRRFPTNISVPKVFWAIDTHQYLPLQTEKAKHFDLVYSAQKNATAALGPKAEWLPAGASLHEVDYQRERTIDVGFVGNISENHTRRAEIVKKLKERIPTFQHFSNIFLKDKAELTSRMKIAVNVSLNNDVNFRVFETLATGALLLTDRITNNGIEDLLIDGVHYISFSSETDLLEKINYYLTHESERIAIAKAGQRIVDEKYRHRVLLERVLSDFRRLLPAFQLNNHTQSMQTNQSHNSSCQERRCWCGGRLSPSVHPLYKLCEQCGTQVLSKLYTPEELKAFYSADGYWHDRQVNVFNFPPIEERAVNDFNDRIPVWFQVLDNFKKAPNRLLEIGCAHGGFLHYCRERGAKDVVGVEVDEGTCKFARQRFNLPHVVSGLFPKVDLPFKAFDAITGFDVIEHFIDPLEGLQGVSDNLADDGICFFQTPWYKGQGGDWVQFKPAEHTFLYSEKGIRMLFERVGIEVIGVVPGYFPDDMFVVGRRQSKRKNIIFVRTDAIGDNVLATSMVRPIAAKYGTKLTVVCSEIAAPLYENLPEVARVIPFNRERIITEPNYRNNLVETLAACNADVVLNSVYSRDVIADFLTRACNGNERIGFNGNLSNIDAPTRDQNNSLYTRIIETDQEHLPELLRHGQFLEALSIPTTQVSPVISLTETEQEFATSLLSKHRFVKEKTVVLGALSNYEIKNYPHWTEALSEVCKESDISIIALGSQSDFARVQTILDNIGVQSLNLCGQTSLRQSAAIIEQSKLVVATDTAIPHMASALGVPNVVVMGGGHFGRFFPYSQFTSMVCLPLECYGCNWSCKYGTAHCIRDLAPAVVAEAIRFSLNGYSTSKPRVFMQSATVLNRSSNQSGPRWTVFSQWLDPERIELVVVSAIESNSRKNTPIQSTGFAKINGRFESETGIERS